VEPIPGLNFVNLLLHLIHAAQFNSRSSSSFVGHHARSYVFVSEHFEMRTDFFVEVALHTLGQEDVSQKTPRFNKERH
jgi:hypothetical protein